MNESVQLNMASDDTARMHSVRKTMQGEPFSRLLLKTCLCLCVAGIAASCSTEIQARSGSPLPAVPIPGNLLDNPSFEEGLRFWEDVWSRTPGTVHTRVDSGTVHDGAASLKILHKGEKDWSVSGTARVSVIPGEVYELGGSVLLQEGPGRIELSVVTRDTGGEVLDWLFADVSASQPGSWKQLSRRFMVPKGVASLQFRITGLGASGGHVDRMYLVRARNAVKPFVSDARYFRARQEDTEITYDAQKDRVLLSFRDNAAVYTLEGFSASGILTAVTADDTVLRARVDGADEEPVSVVFEITDKDIIRCTVESRGRMSDDVPVPGVLRGLPGQSWVVPQNEGLLIPADDPWYRPWNLDAGEGHGGLSMPFIGLAGGSGALMVLSLTPDDVYASYSRPGGKDNEPSGFSFMWKSQRGQWGYRRVLEFRFVETGGYVGIAKAYRDIAKEQGKLVTLREKREKVPELDRLIGSANIWWWEKAEWWTHDMNSASAAASLAEAGMDRVLWSHEASPETIVSINELGFVSGKYDMYQDVWAPDAPIGYGNRKGWPEDLVLLPDGTMRTGWIAKANGKEYPGGVICSSRGFERMKREVPQELATHPYLARFVDTTTAAPLYECHHPDHPLTRTGDREYKSRMLSFLKSESGLITGSETGIDWAVPFVHYFEGMMSLGPYRFDDAGYDLTTYKEPTQDMLRFQTGPYYRIPLFELVYHDCVVNYWYWGDASNRNPELMRDRDLFNLLYGTGPLYILDPARWERTKDGIMESYRVATMTARACGYEELVDHRFLNTDHTLQYSRFSDGTEVWVNFSLERAVLPDGRELEAKGYLITQQP
ncbi:MAG: carbohydrate binding domain-containing protein [Spirochaetales bacterium]|nr:carbohydrate binding domain-containing protein [Spirochaetales bacterium]